MATVKNKTGLFSLTEKQRSAALSAAAVSSVDITSVAMFAGGKEITNEVRDQLLAKCKAGEYVEITLSVRAYEQQVGVRNRNCVRIADNKMAAFGKSGKGKPWLRDHQQRDSLAVGGEISTSANNHSDGHDVVNLEVTLTATWAVELALRGLMKFVSVGWMATGEVTCDACNAPVFTKCYHFPGDKLKSSIVDGKQTFKWDRAGDITVQWIYNGAEMIECSSVPVPAVPTARIDGIRLQMMETMGIDPDRDDLDVVLNNLPSQTIPPETTKMTITPEELAALNARLALAEKLNGLNDKERAYFTRLSGTERESFLSKSLADRAELLKPCFTSKNGTEYTAADDPRMVAMAKERDADREEMDKKLKEASQQTIMAQVDSQLGHLPGTREERAVLLGAISDIKDPAMRTYAIGILTMKEATAKKGFVRQGAGGNKTPTVGADDPQAKMDALVKAHMDKEDCEEDEAYGAVMATTEGVELYSEIENAKRPQASN